MLAWEPSLPRPLRASLHDPAYYLHLGLFALGSIVGALWLALAWARLPEEARRTRDGRTIRPLDAVARLLVPGYNLYWIFLVSVGLARSTNRELERRGLSPRAPEKGAVVAVILQLVPYVNLFLGPWAWAAFVGATDRAQRDLHPHDGAPGAALRAAAIAALVPALLLGSGALGIVRGTQKRVGEPPPDERLRDRVHVDGATFHRRAAWAHAPGEARPVRAFSIDRTEVTVGAYRLCVELGPCWAPEFRHNTRRAECTWATTADADKLPINCVTLSEAETFCRWINARLPTEDEWELAAAGPDDTPPPLRSTRDHCRQPCAVGSQAFDKSPAGAVDMYSNLSEMTASGVARGDSFDEKVITSAALSDRKTLSPELEDATVGFRCAM
jgi:hypothetical protein